MMYTHEEQTSSETVTANQVGNVKNVYMVACTFTNDL